MPKKNNIKKVLVIGSGPIVIGQAAGFQQLQALEHLTVTAEHLSDRNSAKEKNKITTVSTQDITCEAGQIQCILKPYSWNVLRVKERIE